MGIFDIIRLLSFVGLIGGAAWGFSKYSIYEKSEIAGYENTIVEQQATIDRLTDRNHACEDAKQQLLENNQFLQNNITELSTEVREQNQNIIKLNVQRKDAEARVSELESIFSDHNFNTLVERDPGRLETLINTGTKRALLELQQTTNTESETSTDE